MAGRIVRGRTVRWAAFVLFLVGVGLLSLADRAPGRVESALHTLRARAHEVEQRLGIDWIDRSDVPLAWDTAGHLVLWAVAAMLGYAALRRRTGLVMLALGLFALSAGVEVGQAYLSSTRSAQLSDLVANGLGVCAGLGAAALLATLAHHMGGRAPSLSQ